jgi:hypothetical protein
MGHPYLERFVKDDEDFVASFLRLDNTGITQIQSINRLVNQQVYVIG